MFEDLISTLKYIFEYQSAISKSIAVAKNGGSLPEIAKAFADETENKVDDIVAEKISVHIQDAADGLDSVAKFIGALSLLLESHTPSVIERTKKITQFIEENSDEIQMFLHKVSDLAAEVSDKIEELGKD